MSRDGIGTAKGGFGFNPAKIERLGVWRRTVLVADPSPLRLSDEIFQQIPNMKAKTSENRELEPVGIVISRGMRAEPAPLILAFEWGPAPDVAPASRDHKAA